MRECKKRGEPNMSQGIRQLINAGVDLDRPIAVVKPEFRCLPFFCGSGVHIRGFNVLNDAARCRTLGDLESITPRFLIEKRQVGAKTIIKLVTEYSDINEKLERLCTTFDLMVQRALNLESASRDEVLVSWARDRSKK
jgi:hypothetical protein